MAAITDLSAVINRATGGNSGTPESIWVYKDWRTAGAAATASIAGRATSLWSMEGSLGNGSAPGAVAVPTNATAGGLLQANPGGGRQKWLIGGWAGASAPGSIILYDRLLHISGLSGTVTTAQTVGGTLSRYTDGLGNQIWVEVYTLIGASSTTITASYQDQGNAASTTQAVAIGNTNLREAQRVLPLTLASGDYGVQAVNSVTLAATTGTAGDFGVTVAHPLMALSIPAAGTSAIRNCLVEPPGPIEIKTNACLSLLWVPQSSASPQFFANFFFIEM